MINMIIIVYILLYSINPQSYFVIAISIIVLVSLSNFMTPKVFISITHHSEIARMEPLLKDQIWFSQDQLVNHYPVDALNGENMFLFLIYKQTAIHYIRIIFMLRRTQQLSIFQSSEL